MFAAEYYIQDTQLHCEECGRAAYRQQLSHSTLQQRVVDRKRQCYLVAACIRCDERPDAERVIEVRWVHLCTLERRTRLQLRDCQANTAPSP